MSPNSCSECWWLHAAPPAGTPSGRKKATPSAGRVCLELRCYSGTHYTVFRFLGGHRQRRGSGELAWRWDRCSSGRTLGPRFQRLRVVGVQSAPPSAPQPAAARPGRHQGNKPEPCVLGQPTPTFHRERQPAQSSGTTTFPRTKHQLLGLCDVQACSCPCIHAERSPCLSLPTTASLWPPVRS